MVVPFNIQGSWLIISLFMICQIDFDTVQRYLQRQGWHHCTNCTQDIASCSKEERWYYSPLSKFQGLIVGVKICLFSSLEFRCSNSQPSTTISQLTCRLRHNRQAVWYVDYLLDLASEARYLLVCWFLPVCFAYYWFAEHRVSVGLNAGNPP